MHDNTILQASWFFLADNRIEERRVNYSVLNMASDMGGMTKVIFGFLAIIAQYINAEFINSKMIRSLYFLPLEE